MVWNYSSIALLFAGSAYGSVSNPPFALDVWSIVVGFASALAALGLGSFWRGRKNMISAPTNASLSALKSEPPLTAAEGPAVRSGRQNMIDYSVAGKTVLVVDDDSLVSELIMTALSLDGLKVCQAASGHEALASIRTRRPDLVILDRMMPDLSGEEVLKVLRSSPEWQDLPVVLLTAHHSASDRMLGFGLGADDYMTKPIEPRELVLRVQNLLGRIELMKTRARQEQTILLEKKMSLGIMASGIAHEINNPLAIINGYINNLEAMRAAGDLDAQALQHIFGRLTTAVGRISHIVQSMLLIGGDQRGSGQAVQDPDRIVEAVTNLVQERLKSYGIAFQIETRHGEVKVFCQAGAIAQALVNLILNAADAVERSHEKVIFLRTMVDGVGFRFEVEDTGPGVPETIAAKVFDPFFTTKEVGKGMGLGLGIARTFVEQQGGTLLLDSNQPNKFCIELPVAA